MLLHDWNKSSLSLLATSHLCIYHIAMLYKKEKKPTDIIHLCYMKDREGIQIRFGFLDLPTYILSPLGKLTEKHPLPYQFLPSIKNPSC